MDMTTIEAVVRTADPADWRAGDAWLAGGTVLFSYGSFAFGQEPPRRLLDLGSTGWPAITVSESGIELAATCTVAELYALPDGDTGRAHAAAWPALELIRPCCDSFVASFKVWNMSTVGGNLCTSLPAGPMISLCAALDGVATVLGPGGASRTVPVAEFVTGDGRNALAPGELLRSIHLPASALVLAGGVPPAVAEQPGTFRGAADRTARRRRRTGPHRHRRHQAPRAAALRQRRRSAGTGAAAELSAALDAAIPDGLYHDDIHGLPAWRKDMTYRLAEEIRAELAAPAGTAPARVSGDFWPPPRTSPQASHRRRRRSRKGPEHGHRDQRRNYDQRRAGAGRTAAGAVPADVPAGAGQPRREEGLRRRRLRRLHRPRGRRSRAQLHLPRGPRGGPGRDHGGGPGRHCAGAAPKPAPRASIRCSSSSWNGRASSAASAPRAW